MITGGQTDDEIERNKELFQNDPRYKMIVVSYQRGGEGHTLTAASNVIMLEMGWTYKDQSQAEDRAYRAGQKNNVNVYYFLGKDTLDENIYEIILGRAQMECALTGSNEQFESSEQGTTFGRLLKSLQKEGVTA